MTGFSEPSRSSFFRSWGATSVNRHPLGSLHHVPTHLAERPRQRKGDLVPNYRSGPQGGKERNTVSLGRARRFETLETLEIRYGIQLSEGFLRLLGSHGLRVFGTEKMDQLEFGDGDVQDAVERAPGLNGRGTTRRRRRVALPSPRGASRAVRAITRPHDRHYMCHDQRQGLSNQTNFGRAIED